MKKRLEKKISIFPLTIRSSIQLGNAIRRIRKSLGMSQIILANKAGLTQATISRLEKGLQKAEAGTLLIILAALNVDLMLVARPKQDLKNDLEALY